MYRGLNIRVMGLPDLLVAFAAAARLSARSALGEELSKCMFNTCMFA